MKNVGVIPFYYCFDDERREITRKIFHHYKNVADERGDITFIGIGSEGELSRDIWTEHHDVANYVEYSQEGWPEVLNPGGSWQIRDKFNFSIAQAAPHNPERVWMIQSDDLITARFFDDSTADMVGVGTGSEGGCYLWKHGTDEFYAWNGLFPYLQQSDAMPFCGGNIGYSRQFLDSIVWNPYRFDGDEMGLQRWAMQHGKTFDARLQERDDFEWWLVKGRTCINQWHLFERLEFSFDDVPAEQIEKLLTYWETL